LISPEAVIAKNIATPQEISAMTEIARLAFEVLAHAWRKRDVLLVDLKIEFGRLAGGENSGQLVIADVIDNDSWRIWPQGREDRMLDKQLYRNLETVDDAALAEIKSAYEQVAEFVGPFPTMRPGMVAIFSDSPDQMEQNEHVAVALGQFGLPAVRHVASATKTPGFVLQLVQQHDATFPRLVYIAISSPGGALAEMIAGCTTNPVIDASGDASAAALQCAKIFALEDTILFGRTLLVQTNVRSTVVQADAALNPPPPSNSRLA
ncbi:MAG: AIR carboxylase family protein, partial [Candidatus Eremiobacteraeota bacterium]|nr:AIR carboxylase family protein [Candidatus Eremiobacteraeota bacterium]